MKFWLINPAEPTPVDPGAWRQRRMSLIADELVERGHEVLWWNSTFVHASKTHRYSVDTTVDVRQRYQIRFLHAPGYRRNVSLARIRNHVRLARKFCWEATQLQRPDAILSSYPTIELCYEAVRFGQAHGVPTVLDVRDQWPDLFLDRVPRAARPAGRLALAPYYRLSRMAFRQATAVLGTSREFVAWGLKRGGRSAGPADRDFPFGYAPPRVSPDELDAARAFWQGLGIGNDPAVPVVCFFGALNHHFDFAPVFDAARRLVGRRPVQWVLCGDGERLDEFRRQASEIPGVVLPGWVNGPQIWALMERASFGLAPYVGSVNFLDNIANKPIEYLAGGLPILSSLGSGALRKMLAVNGCGTSYDGDASKLADAVLTAVTRPADHAAQRQRARRLFAEKFDAARVYGDLADHLASLVAAWGERYDPRRAA